MKSPSPPDLKTQIKACLKPMMLDKLGMKTNRTNTTLTEIQALLTSTENKEVLESEWKDILAEMTAIVSSKQSSENKAAIARCIATVYLQLLNEFDKIIAFMKEKIANSKKDEEKALLFRSFNEALNMSNEEGVLFNFGHIQQLMDYVKSYLDTNESPVELIPLLDICITISKIYRKVFADYLNDICDFAIGWFIDRNQPKYVGKKCRELIISLEPYFLNDINHAIKFLKSLKTDILYIIENLAEKTEPDEEIDSIIPMIDVFLLILETSIRKENLQVVEPLIDDLLQRLTKSPSLLKGLSSRAIGNFYACLASFYFRLIETTRHPTAPTALYALVKDMFENDAISPSLLAKLLKYTAQTIPLMDLKSNERILLGQMLLDEDSRINKLPMIRVSSHFVDVLIKLLDANDFNTLQVTYGLLTKQISISIGILNLWLKEETNDYKSVRHHEQMLLIYTLALKPLAAVKNSIAILMGLNPSLFTLIFESFPLTDWNFNRSFSAAQFTFVELAKFYSEQHEHFITTSEWVNDTSKSSFVSESPTSKYFSKILFILSKLITFDKSESNILRLAIDWLQSIASSAQSYMSKIIDKKEFIEVRKAVLYSFMSVSYTQPSLDPSFDQLKRLYPFIHKFKVFELLEKCDSQRIQDLIQKFFNRSAGMQTEHYNYLFSTLPLKAIMKADFLGSISSLMEDQQLQVPDTYFSLQQFTALTNFTLKQAFPSIVLDEFIDVDWLAHFVQYIHTTSIKEGAKDELNHSQKWKWAFAQLARYCVENRMKTPFGKPMDTFTKFETEIRALVTAAINQKLPDSYKVASSEQKHDFNSRVSEEDSDAVVPRRESRKLSPSEEWFRVRCLLYLVEILDKLMFYAARGSIFNVTEVSEISRQFFVTNQNSCQAWISRITLPTMAVAFLNGSYAQVIRMGTFLYMDFQEKANKANKALKLDSMTLVAVCWLVRSMIELKASQAIEGIGAWIKKVFGQDLVWIRGAVLMASGRFELALKTFEECIKDENLDEQVLSTINEMRLKGMTVLRNSEMVKEFGQPLKNIIKNGDRNTEIIAEYKKIQWERTVALTSWEQVIIDSDKCTSQCPWKMQNRIDDIELKLINLWHSYTNKKPANIIKLQLNEISRDLARMCQTQTAAAESSNAFSRVFVLEIVRKIFQQRLVFDNKRPSNPQLTGSNEFDFNKLLEDWKNNTSDRLYIGQQLATWLERFHGKNSPPTHDAHAALAILGRKTQNYGLARYHLGLSEASIAKINEEPRQQNYFPPQAMFPPGIHRMPQMMPPNFAHGFMPQFPMPNMFGLPSPPGFSHAPTPPIDIKSAIQTAKLHWVSSTDGGERGYFQLAEALASHCEQGNNLAALTANNSQSFANLVRQRLSLTANPLNVNLETPEAILAGKAAMHLGNWLLENQEIGKTILNQELTNPRPFWQMLSQRYNEIRWKSFEIDEMTALRGAFYSISCDLCTTLTKAHNTLADWAYENCSISTKPETIPLSISSRLNLMGITSESKDFETIITQMCQTKDFEEFSEDLNDLKLASLDANALKILNELWHSLKRYQYGLFEIALREYFAFLEKYSRSMKSVGNLSTIKATLRILRMLVLFPEWFVKLGDYDRIESVNEDLWKEIIPQLFSRLNHPDIIVRDTICHILFKISQTSPHATCFSAIVGASFGKNHRTDSSPETEELPIYGEITPDLEFDTFELDVANENKRDRSLMAEACTSLVAAIENLYPDLVHDVTSFISELQKISLLHEEKWLFVLSNLDHEVNKRLRQLDHERKNMQAYRHLNDKQKQALLLEKTEAIGGMLYQILSDLYDITCRADPLTVNEAQFRAFYKDELTDALEAFRDHMDDLALAWKAFKNLYKIMNDKAAKKSTFYLRLQEMSPYLSSLAATSIPIPGQELVRYDHEQIVSIARMNKHAMVLPTKTRPKKVSFLGSDGNEYAFLFKGQEDLHLDERVMQLLYISNLMLKSNKNINQNDAWPAYECKNYSVVPLGTRSGLIRWVDGATPIFQVYRKWKTREVSINAKLTEKDGKKSSTRTENPAPENEKPMELFFRKLKESFQKAGLPVDILKERDRWPVQILLDVLQKLIEETPRDILARELWMNAGTCETWWRKTQRFARSTAVMSMVGSVLGLGDRHLDNLMVDLNTGNVIHIDYNICFERGRKLRVPETVPFRLTGNLAYALGPTNIEGTYRGSCEHVLSVLRNEKEVFLMMLDAFIYDPLVDWTNHDHVVSSSTVNVATILAVYGTDERIELAFPLAQKMLKLRIKELKDLWLAASKNLQETLEMLSKVLDEMHSYRKFILHESPLSITDEKTHFEKERIEAGTQLRLALKEHQRIMLLFKPLLRSLNRWDERYGAYLRLYKEKFSDPLVKGLKLLDEKAVDYDKCLEMFRKVLANITTVHESLVIFETASDNKSPTLALTSPDQQFSMNGFAESLGITVKSRVRQLENRHAKGVAKRISNKLDGRELETQKEAPTFGELRQKNLDETNVMSVVEQVEFLINEATDITNLALMYEGWTAWV